MENQTRRPKIKRRTYFLKGSGQGRLVGKLYVVLLVFMLTSAVFLYFIFNRELTDEFYKAHSIIRSTMELLLPWMSIGIALNVVLVLISMVIYTHSIAGPAFCILRDLKAVREGDLTRRFRVRRRDELQEIVAALNDLMETIQQRFAAVERAGEMMEALVQRLREIDAAGREKGLPAEPSLARAEEIRALLRQARKGLKVS